MENLWIFGVNLLATVAFMGIGWLISLVKKNGENKIHPKAILWYNRHETPVDNDNETVLEYMTSDFKAKEYKVTFKPGEKTDLILLFREAEEGDEIIIDDFLTSKIGN